MSYMKSFLEDVSVEMGFGGAINDRVQIESQRRLDQMSKNLTCQALSEYGEEQCLRETVVRQSISPNGESNGDEHERE